MLRQRSLGHILQALVLLKQRLFRLDVLGMNRDARHRTHLHTLGFIEMAHTLSALARVDFVNFWAEVDRLIGAFRFAYIAIDAFIGDHQGHQNLS